MNTEPTPSPASVRWSAWLGRVRGEHGLHPTSGMNKTSADDSVACHHLVGIATRTEQRTDEHHRREKRAGERNGDQVKQATQEKVDNGGEKRRENGLQKSADDGKQRFEDGREDGSE